MDVAALSVNMAQAGLNQAVGVGLLKMVQDHAVTQGHQLIAMMEQSVQPHLGQHINIRL